MTLLQFLVVGGLLVMIPAMVMTMIFRRSTDLIEQWAAESGLTLVSKERRFFRRGPFFWTTSKGQDVYHVIVDCPDGLRRSGFVRCGSFFKGVISDNVDVAWD